MATLNLNLGFKDFYFRLIGIPLVGLAIPLIFFNSTFNTPLYWNNTLFSIFYTALYWHICRYFILKFNNRFPYLTDNKKRLAYIFLFCSLLIIGLCDIIHFFLEPYLKVYQQTPGFFQINAASFVTFVGVASMYEAMRFFDLWKQAIVEKEVLAKANLQSQLEGLKNQVNPHFLFNSLNTLIHIIPENPENAVRFVHQLSKVYRYILEIKESDTTSLNNELKFLVAYIFLLKERFGDNLKVHLAEMNTYSDFQIIPLALQIVLENAIKHNVVSAEKPLTIDIFIENGDKLIVRNNLQLKNQVQEGTGTGLENIKTRYALVSESKMEVIVTPQYFTVILPLLK